MTDGSSGRITDEALAKLRARIGKEHPINEPFTRYINSDSIRRMSYALGDPNPLWLDEEYARKTRHGRLVAPPAILYGSAWGAADMRRGHGLPGVHGLHSADDWTWYRPLVDGDRVRITRTLIKADEREGAYAGRSVLQVREFRFYDQDDLLVARCQMSSVRAERERARGRGKYSDLPLGRYTPDEIAAIDAVLEQEEPRGQHGPHFADVAAGDEVPVFVRGPITVGDIVMFHMGAGGAAHIGTGRTWLNARRQSPKRVIIHPESGIPHGVQEVHHDSQIAWIAGGMPAAYDLGAQRGAWTTVPFTNWLGDDGFLARLNVQYRGMNFLGDTTWWRARVEETLVGRTSGAGYVRFSFEARNQRGDLSVKGSAVGVLPHAAGVALEFPLDVDQDLPSAG